MFRWFLPKEPKFFDYFEKHALITVEACREFLLLTEPGADIIEKVSRIKELEHQADNITHQCVEALHKTFITPFERNDIHRLITVMDDVIDFTKDAAARVETYRLVKMTPEVHEMAGILMNASQEISSTINGLRHLKHVDAMRQSFVTINRLENEGDIVLRHAIGRLFDEEQDVKNIIKWKEVYENLEMAIDSCEDVSNIIEGVILENE